MMEEPHVVPVVFEGSFCIELERRADLGSVSFKRGEYLADEVVTAAISAAVEAEEQTSR